MGIQVQNTEFLALSSGRVRDTLVRAERDLVAAAQDDGEPALIQQGGHGRAQALLTFFHPVVGDGDRTCVPGPNIGVPAGYGEPAEGCPQCFRTF